MAKRTPHYQHDDLWDFLRKRGVAEENMNRMPRDKVDSSLVREREDVYLSRYIPVYGSRIATRCYCLDRQTQKKVNSLKMSLLEKLRKKMRTATASQSEESEQESRPARKVSDLKMLSSRKIELGWIHDGKQVRQRCGGGTRVLDVPKNSTREDILSKKGQWEDFIHHMYDFKESELDESTTVGELHSLSTFGILRFYRNTTCRFDKSDAEVDSKMDTSGEQQRQIDYSDQKQEKTVSVIESQIEPFSTAEELNHGSSRAHSAVADVNDLSSQSYDS